MSFKFFPDPATPPTTPTTTPCPTHALPSDAVSKETIIQDSHVSLNARLTLNPSETCVTSLLNLKCVNIQELPKHVTGDPEVLEILKSTSDLKSGVYEGGFKTWECTYDLVTYIHEHEHEVLPSTTTNNPFRILDLGCGTGLLGLSLLRMCTTTEKQIDVRVDFQDYNPKVLDYVTIQNTLLNFPDDNTTLSRCRYFSGDWSSFSNFLTSKNQPKYDLIVSSETIYNLEYLPRFIDVIKTALNTNACMYVAAKTFYFGVGGGTNVFLRLINETPELEGETVHVFKEGVKREIIRIRNKPR